MSKLALVALETTIALRRDRIFIILWALVLGVAAAAHLASNWGVEEYTKILFDLGFTGLSLAGGTVAIVWGVRLVSEAQQSGALELRLAGPISRGQFYSATYAGLAVILLCFGAILATVWQLLMFANDFGVMGTGQWQAFAALILSWLVLGALAMALAALTNTGLALVLSYSLWTAGLLTGPSQHLGIGEANILLTPIQTALATIWNFQHFNLIDFAAYNAPVPTEVFFYTLIYGLGLIAILVGFGVLAIKTKDL